MRITRLVFGLVLLFFCSILVILFFRHSANNKKRKLLEIEQRLNRVRMDPHFIFNVLTTLQIISQDPKRHQEIGIYITRFSKIMRQALESTFNELTSLEEELDFLSNYLELQKLVTRNKFTYSFEVDPQIDPFEVRLPAMMLQPFLENSIVHGFTGEAEPGHIELKIYPMNGMLLAQITDNGHALELVKMNKKYPSRANQITSDRLTLLNAIYKKKCHFELAKRTGGGMQVQLFLPLIFQK